MLNLKLGISKNSTKTIYLASYGSPAPLQIGSCGGESASVSEPNFRAREAGDISNSEWWSRAAAQPLELINYKGNP